jgi:hypothetical protein
VFQQFRFGDRNAAGCFRIEPIAVRNARPNRHVFFEYENSDRIGEVLRALRTSDEDNRLPGRQYWNVILAGHTSDGDTVFFQNQLDANCVDHDAREGLRSLDCRGVREQAWKLRRVQ